MRALLATVTTVDFTAPIVLQDSKKKKTFNLKSHYLNKYYRFILCVTKSIRSLKLKNDDTHTHTHTFLTLINLIRIDAFRESGVYLSNLILVNTSKSESSCISESFKYFRNRVLIFKISYSFSC